MTKYDDEFGTGLLSLGLEMRQDYCSMVLVLEVKVLVLWSVILMVTSYLDFLPWQLATRSSLKVNYGHMHTKQ